MKKIQETTINLQKKDKELQKLDAYIERALSYYYIDNQIFASVLMCLRSFTEVLLEKQDCNDCTLHFNIDAVSKYLKCTISSNQKFEEDILEKNMVSTLLADNHFLNEEGHVVFEFEVQGLHSKAVSQRIQTLMNYFLSQKKSVSIQE